MSGGRTSGTSISALELLLQLLRRHLGRVEAGDQLDRIGLALRDHGDAQQDAVRDQNAVAALQQRRIEEPERGDGALGGDAGALDGDDVADAEGTRAQQHGAGHHVAERLLRGETDDHRGEGTADGERRGIDAGDRERAEDDGDDREEADQETDAAGGRRVHAAHQRRRDSLGEGPGQTPADQYEEKRGDVADDLALTFSSAGRSWRLAKA